MDNMQSHEALGHDGFLIESFWGFCDFLGENIIKVMEESRTQKMVLCEFNSTFFATKSKVNNSFQLDHFHSIISL